jgi:competence protein ComEC
MQKKVSGFPRENIFIMSPEMRHFSFNLLLLLYSFYFGGCNQSFEATPRADASFTVVDVGQGLSQILAIGDSAVIFDMGPPEGENEWRRAFTSLGSPSIAAIFISHRDRDHSGGLQFIDNNLPWTGNMITGDHEDTSFLRQQCSRWDNEIRITAIRRDDLILFCEACSIRCLWPPASIAEPVPVSEMNINRYNLVLSVHFYSTSLLLTGDIDSSGEKMIYRMYGSTLKSDLMVLPHHGSRASVDYLFYAYVQPSTAIISAGQNNDFGHPSSETLEMLARLGIPYETTVVKGSLTWLSNGFYWTALF